MSIDHNLYPVDFPSARIMGSLSEAFAHPFSAGENLRIVPASLSGDFDAVARRIAAVAGNTKRYKRDLSISERRGYIGLEKGFLTRNWALFKARWLGLGAMSCDEKLAFDTIVDDMDMSISLGASPLLRVIYTDEEFFHADGGPSVFLRSYNYAGTRYIRDNDTAKVNFSRNRYKKIGGEDYEMPLGWYSFHLSQDAPLENGGEVEMPSVHTSPPKAPSDTPRLLKISSCAYDGPFGLLSYYPK